MKQWYTSKDFNNTYWKQTIMYEWSNTGYTATNIIIFVTQ